MLVGWIPFLGLIAIPAAVIGFLLAGIGFLIALFKRGKGIVMPIVAGLVCSAAFVVPILSTGGTSAAISKTHREYAKIRSETETRKKAQEADETKAKAAYIRDHLVLYDVEARYMSSVLDGRVPGVLFKLRNGGDRDLDMVEVTVGFKDDKGVVIHEEQYRPVFVTEFSFGDNKPLKAGHVWQMERGKFYSAKSVPSEWKQGSVDAKISDIKFSQKPSANQTMEPTASRRTIQLCISPTRQSAPMRALARGGSSWSR